MKDERLEMNKIPFNKPLLTGNEEKYLKEALSLGKYCGDGSFTKKCNSELEKKFGLDKALLTTSCSHALDMSALLLDVGPEDEVIMPSFTFVSTANAFALRGAKIKFVDINPKTMNIDENLIEKAITKNTRVIVPVHYAGVSCEMDKINELAKQYKLFVVEDAAQGVMSKYKGKALGGIGDLGCYSFHETKNYTMGEGGALCINNPDLVEKAEIIREKGTDRSKFLRGQVDKYSWRSVGSSYLPSEFNAAFLYGQLDSFETVNEKRLTLWNKYYERLKDLAQKERLELPYIPEGCEHNAHMFYIKLKDIKERTKLIEFLKDHDVQTAFHYVPLHSSEAGLKYGSFVGEDVYTTKESERLLRLPMFYDLSETEVTYICELIEEFFK